MNGRLADLASLLRDRDEIERRIAGITGRSARQGDIGEFIAAHVFDIELTSTTVEAGYDGWFRSGPLEGRTVNVKTYGSAAAGIDISSHACDYYLVLTGPPKPTGPVQHHRWSISAIYLFETQRLLAEFISRGVRIGVATSLRAGDLAAAQLYPVHGAHALLNLTAEQREGLARFA
ncbi:hypothetical protein Q0Z83_039530 [Actinoplanes sichuanensis]|uniref:DUF6998 domain-containing protein n=1 Tax=Actinoplanes sichuanensis TaxID=512349 RepID=A0ABW4A3L4_9ACTN|nr:hypothetical protein [Actinoplanes sichuanensis]BEL05762.1 hypothetical protein Q0Z83_039530 [Actinoplanes sichuanensis]